MASFPPDAVYYRGARESRSWEERCRSQTGVFREGSLHWVHDLAAFHALSTYEQERVIGRSKSDSIELTGADMPPDWHVSRTDAERDGVAQKIYRRSVPFGRVAEHGLYFPAFACQLARLQFLLERMYGATSDGVHDRLIEYTMPVSGSYLFAPSAPALARALQG